MFYFHHTSTIAEGFVDALGTPHWARWVVLFSFHPHGECLGGTAPGALQDLDCGAVPKCF